MSLFHVPLYISAGSPDELIRLMIKKQIEAKITYKWHDIRKNGDKWFAWYDSDAIKIAKKVVNDGTQKDFRGS